MLGIAALANLTALIFACTEEQHSSVWHYTDRASSVGRYTYESWSCQLGHKYGGYDPNFERLSRTCGKAVSQPKRVRMRLANFNPEGQQVVDAANTVACAA